jgi:hypothetical protein
MIWLEREKVLRQRIFDPWSDAIKNDDGIACDLWYAIGLEYPLLKARVVLNPIVWISYWNWKPKDPTTLGD